MTVRALPSALGMLYGMIQSVLMTVCGKAWLSRGHAMQGGLQRMRRIHPCSGVKLTSYPSIDTCC